MPLFEYQCKECERVFEELVYSGSEKIHCPSCASSKVEKILSTFGVRMAQNNPCSSGVCGMPGPSPACGQGCCPSCMD
ncbi:MAG: FmdB family zinc ribbon protein [Candidatus Omnitrophota bacterium]